MMMNINPVTGGPWPGSGVNNNPTIGVNVKVPNATSPIKAVMPAGQAPSKAAPGGRQRLRGGRAGRHLVK